LFYSIICSIKVSRRSILPWQQYALHFLVRLAELCGRCLTQETLRDVAFHINCTLVTTSSSDSMHMDYFDQRSRHNEKGFVNWTDRMRQDDQRQHDERDVSLITRVVRWASLEKSTNNLKLNRQLVTSLD
jgi:hypothetical protein